MLVAAVQAWTGSGPGKLARPWQAGRFARFGTRYRSVTGRQSSRVEHSGQRYHKSLLMEAIGDQCGEVGHCGHSMPDVCEGRRTTVAAVRGAGLGIAHQSCEYRTDLAFRLGNSAGDERSSGLVGRWRRHGTRPDR